MIRGTGLNGREYGTDTEGRRGRMPDALRIGLLGPLQVRDVGGRTIAVGGRQLRVLLILLALDAGRVVPSGSLAEQLWPGDLPINPGNALQTLVSRLRAELRRAGLDDVIESHPPGTGSSCRRPRWTRWPSRRSPGPARWPNVPALCSCAAPSTRPDGRPRRSGCTTRLASCWRPGSASTPRLSSSRSTCVSCGARKARPP